MANERDAPDEDDAGGALIAAMLSVIERTHGPLNEAARQQLREGLRRAQSASAALYAYPLSNADEPGTIFRPFRAD
ncbi:MAG TPA: hypothetical protein VH916_04645 [Dehalococcoidia bacterium]|jgi:hypothetical protein